MKLIGNTSAHKTALIVMLVISVSLLHYLTPLYFPHRHDVLQRLYYLPIILAALWYGLRGGLLCAVAVSIAYAPHLIFQWGSHQVSLLEKYLEVLLYNIIGGVTGFLSQRERNRSLELLKATKGLEDSNHELQLQLSRVKDVESKLRQAEKLSVLGEMAAVLAHEIKNPLTVIRGHAELLRKQFAPDDRNYESTQTQIREIVRLNNLLTDFLNKSRPKKLAKQRCNVIDELQTMVLLVAHDAGERQIRVVLTPAPLPIVVKADSEQLRQVFFNIIINALQATPAGGSLVISAKAYQTSLCEISFRDTGSGIDEASLQKIFEPFYTTKSEGTGLGLAVSKSIIQTHCGVLLVESELGRGTTVIIRLPIQS